MLSWLVLQCCWSRRGPLWCVHPGTWCCSLSPRSHHWWSEEHAESALSWSQQQSPSSLHIQREIVVTAPPSQAAHLAPVVCLISVADETHHSRVIHKFNEEVGVVWRWCSRGSAHSSEEEGAQHTSLGGPLCSVWWCWMCFTADPYCLRSPGQKVQQLVAQRRIEPQLDQFMNELLRDDCVEVYEQQSDIRVRFVQVCEGWVEGSGDGIIGRAIGPICKLEGVQGGGEDRLDVLHD